MIALLFAHLALAYPEPCGNPTVVAVLPWSNATDVPLDTQLVLDLSSGSERCAGVAGCPVHPPADGMMGAARIAMVMLTMRQPRR